MCNTLTIHNINKLVSTLYFKMGDKISPPFFGSDQEIYWIAFSEYTTAGKYGWQHRLNIERTILESPMGNPYIRIRYVTHNIENGKLNLVPKITEFKMYLTDLINPNPLAEEIAKLVENHYYLPNRITRQMLASYW